jgi:hypothetical protein
MIKKYKNPFDEFAEGGKTREPMGYDLPEIRSVGQRPRGRGGVFKLRVEDIEHGEAATPGGTLTWPGARELIREYAARPTPFPPIEVMPPEAKGGKWMVYDGSRRLEAAKLRGDKYIDAINPFPPEVE